MSDDGSGDERELERAIAEYLAEVDDLSTVPELPTPRGPLQIGDLVGGDFRLGEELGHGASGVVFAAARVSAPTTRVAVKVLRDFVLAPGAKERFAREVAVAARLDHPAIVPVVAADLDASPPWLAMKLIDGVSMGQLVAHLRRADEPWSTEPVAELLGVDAIVERDYMRWIGRVGVALAEALAHAHEFGVLHRDIKPWNVLIDRRGMPVLIDLGLARREDDVTLTRTGAFVGTLAYSAPEQIRGESIDERADVYGLGATLFELVNLARPYEEWSRDALLGAIDREPRLPFRRAVPAELRTIITTALAARRGHRYADARAMAADLGAFLAGTSIRARRAGPLRRGATWLRRHRAVAAAVSVVIVLLAVWATTRWRATELLLERGDVELAHARDAHRDWMKAAERLRADLLDGAGLRDGGIARARLARTAAAADGAAESAEVLYRQAATRALAVAAAGPRARLTELAAHRVRVALDRFDDVLDGATLAALTSELERLDEDAGFGALSDRRGAFELDTTPSGVAFELLGGDGEVVVTGTTPWRGTGIMEGSYVAVIDAPGVPPIRYPLLVRRAACDGARAPGPSHRVRLPAADEHPGASFTYVPGGWSLVEDDPPTWRHFDDFFMQTDETTMGEWADYMSENEDAATPRFGPDQPLIVRRESEWMYVTDPTLADAERARVPVRGLAREDMRELLARRRSSAPPGWRLALPCRDEWIRAARGADGRRYPWGDGFSWDRTLGYHSRESIERDRWPQPADVATSDVSPFGIRHLAGSVAEMCTEDSEPDRSRVVIAGGSYATVNPEGMGVLARRLERNAAILDTGLRPVLRRLPAWSLDGAPIELPFVDDFERADSRLPGGSWHEVVEMPPSPERVHAPVEWVSIEAGDLRLRGGVGDGSRSANAVLPLHLDGRPLVLTLELTVGAHEPLTGLRSRSLNVVVYSAPFSAAQKHLTFQLHPGPVDRISFSGVARGSAPAAVACFDRRIVIELSVDGPRIETRLWPAGGTRPQRPALAARASVALASSDLLQLTASNLVGLDARIHRIELR